MKAILLTQGFRALVSDKDYPRLRRFNWCVSIGSKGRPYAMRKWGRTTVLMHCEILGVKGVDHINNDPLDNRRSNLRVASQSQNMANQRKHKDNRSGYKGVTQYAHTRRWMARVKIKNKNLYLGCFSNPADAARAYDAAAIKHFGEFACLNFPKSTNQNQKLKI